MFPSTEYVRLLRLWVVSNSGDGDCGTGDIHARARNFRRRVVEGDFCAHTCISPELCISPASNANDLGLRHAFPFHEWRSPKTSASEARRKYRKKWEIPRSWRNYSRARNYSRSALSSNFSRCPVFRESRFVQVVSTRKDPASAARLLASVVVFIYGLIL